MDWLSNNWLYLLLLGVVFFMGRGGMGCGMGHMGSRRGHRHGSGNDGMDDARAGAAGTDPVSGRPIDPQSAVTTVHRGRIYYFESRENRDRFEATPERYAGQGAEQSHAHRRHGGGHC